MKYNIYFRYWDDFKAGCQEWYKWGADSNHDRANEVAMQVREEKGGRFVVDVQVTTEVWA